MTKSEQPIYPAPYQNQDNTVQHDVYFGLTKLEYFSGLAMQGMLANPNGAADGNSRLTSPVSIARLAVAQARYLLEEINRQNK